MSPIVNRPLPLRWVLIAIYAILYSTAIASDKPDSLKTFLLPVVRVIIAKDSEAIGSVSKLRTSDLGLASTVREAFVNSPGISATTGSKDESNLRLRGFRKNEVKILVDGRPLTNGYFGNVDLGKLALMDISEIQIIKGPASPLYGTNHMGGVVNIITATPNNQNWLSLQGTVQRNNTQNIRISSSHSFGSWSYNLGAAADRSDGFVLSKDFFPTYSENGGVRNNSAKTQYNLRGGLSSEFLQFHNLSLDFSYSGMAKKDIPSSVYESKYRRYENWMRFNAACSGELNLNENLQLSAVIANDGATDRYLEYKDPAYQDLNVDSWMHNRSWLFAPRLKWLAASDKTLDFGYHLELQRNRRKDNISYLDWTTSSVILNSVFCQFEYQIDRQYRLTTAMGLAGSAVEGRSDWQMIPEPSLGLERKTESGAISSLSIGASSAQPTMRQLFSSDKGNPDLQAQHAYKAELSHLQPLIGSALSISASAFYNDTRKLIDLRQGRFENIYRVLSHGFETGINLSPTKWYELQATYAFLDYQKNSDYRLTETPKHSVSINNHILLPLKAKLQINTVYRDLRVSQDEGGVYHNLEAYWLHDAMIRIPWGKAAFSLGIINIFDRDYQGEYGFPEPGRDFKLGMEIIM